MLERGAFRGYWLITSHDDARCSNTDKLAREEVLYVLVSWMQKIACPTTNNISTPATDSDGLWTKIVTAIVSSWVSVLTSATLIGILFCLYKKKLITRNQLTTITTLAANTALHNVGILAPQNTVQTVAATLIDLVEPTDSSPRQTERNEAASANSVS